MKRIFQVIFILSFVLLNTVICHGYDFPHEFWAVNKQYTQAVNKKNNKDIIKYGEQSIEIMKNAPEGADKDNTMITRYYAVGVAYEELKNYDKSREIFEKLYDYVLPLGEKYSDYVKSASARVRHYTSKMEMYTDDGASTYYNATNEHENGVLFGTCSNGATRKKLEHESMVLTYQELGTPLLTYNIDVLKKAAAEGLAVEFALNCPKEARDIRNIDDFEDDLDEISELFAKYPDTPIFLRFGAEFNIWLNEVKPGDFIAAFRDVSKFFKNRNENVAMVWSPNQVSAWNIDMDDYYPGDKYVDWVGVSLYAQKYFLGDDKQPAEYELCFNTGANSDPVVAMAEIIEKYGDRKPIMLSESGCSHTLVDEDENISTFGLNRLKEYMSYLPMVYPQIKLMAYFDWYVDGELNDYRLSTNKAMQDEYIKRTKSSRFIQDSHDNHTNFCYRKIRDGIGVDNVFPVSTYVHKYDSEVLNVTYYLDNTYIGKSTDIPYTTYVDASSLDGKYTLKATAYFKDGTSMTSKSDIIILDGNDNISVEVSGKKLNFDQNPVIYNDRTLVPMRKIFESLGASVSWDDITKTATSKKGDRTISITLDDKTMYVNNKEIQLDTAPIILSGRTLVPVRAVAEGLGCNVNWDGKSSKVSIEPKVFTWSSWNESLPKNITPDSYYIEEKTEYRMRKRELEYFELQTKNTFASNYVDEKITYGKWSGWSRNYAKASDSLEVETRERSEPKKYHYIHYCTGKISDKNNRYKTTDYDWHDECTYHDLGWFDSPLPLADDYESGDKLNYFYYVNGDKYRCNNSCFRWYLEETTGGTYTEYNSRPIYRSYIYCEWGDWSRWSSWDEDKPKYNRYDDEIDYDIQERTVYRYKEK